MSLPTTVVYIAGQGRSGSTLLERLLGGLPGVRTLGEAVHMWQESTHRRERCSCGTRFVNCDFWRAVGDRAYGGWHRLDRARMRALLTATARTRLIPLLVEPLLTGGRRATIEEWVGYYTRIHTAAAELTGQRVVTDSSKNPAIAYCLRQALDVDLRVVHLVRDPRGVAYSATKHVPLPEYDGAATLPRHTPGRTAARWNAKNLALSLLPRVGRAGTALPVRQVRYEDLVADPAGTVRALAEFAGVPVGEGDLSYLGEQDARLEPVHSASGNPMRFTSGRITLHGDEAWRTDLPAGQRWLVSAACAPLLRAYRYPLTAVPVERA